MSKFEVKHNTCRSDNYMITDGRRNYMHQDGSIVSKCSERWPTREQAQAVLDKYQPKHEWKHGDVFQRECTGSVMVYLVSGKDGARVYKLNDIPYEDGDIDVCLADATFLFNIKDRL